MPPTVTPAPHPPPYSPGHRSTAPGPKAGSPSRRPAPPKASPRHTWTTRSRSHHLQQIPRLRSALARLPPVPPQIPRQRPRSTRPEALFLHPLPVETGTRRRHQPHKKSRSASSAIPRQIHRAQSAPVTAPFLRLLHYSPSPSAKPVSTVLPSSKYRFAMSSALISCSPPFCAFIVISC